jgi:RNA-directed DNA polymerase
MFTARTEEHPATTGADIHWHTVEGQGRRLPERIYRATTNTAWRTVKPLQTRLVRATANTLLAIRRITPEHQGNHTAGLDAMVDAPPEARWTLLQAGLSLTGYPPRPGRRGYSPKDHGQQSPWGIPTGQDRVMQAMIKAALEPAWEARFEANADGFRPGRCTRDAVEAIQVTMTRQEGRQWGLDADLSGGFDHIDHEPWGAQRPVFTTTRRRWLKAGVVEVGCCSPTDPGTPQGGVISPRLAHVALDGMARVFDAEDAEGRPQAPACRTGNHKGRAGMR